MKVLNVNISNFKSQVKQLVTLVFIMSISALIVQAQTPFKVVAGSQIKVEGTSNIHDWTMVATSFSCDGTLILKGDQLQDVTALNFSLPVTNLKGKEDLLNSRAHKALKAEQFNRITFKLTNATVNAQQKVIRATGNLTIAGVTKTITLQSNYIVSGNEVTFKGTAPVKMSDFNIKAPSFMMGALKVADAVSIEITLKVKN